MDETAVGNGSCEIDRGFATATGSAAVLARGSAIVVLRDVAVCRACGRAHVVADDRTAVIAYDDASVAADGDAHVHLRDRATCTAYGRAVVTVNDHATVRVASPDVTVYVDSNKARTLVAMAS